MNIRTLCTILVSLLSGNCLADDEGYWKNVFGSFDALMTHEAIAGTERSVLIANERDPVEVYVHTALRGERTASPVLGASFGQDHLTSAFERMLNHTPHYGQTGVNVSPFERDPAEIMIHAALARQFHGAHSLRASR